MDGNSTTGVDTVATAVVDVIEQPTDLATLAQRYVDQSLHFIASAKSASKPFFLYLAWNHIHSPNFASTKFCSSSARGPVGDAAQEMDDAIGQVGRGRGEGEERRGRGEERERRGEGEERRGEGEERRGRGEERERIGRGGEWVRRG
jgi:hypothetical protein